MVGAAEARYECVGWIVRKHKGWLGERRNRLLDGKEGKDDERRKGEVVGWFVSSSADSVDRSSGFTHGKRDKLSAESLQRTYYFAFCYLGLILNRLTLFIIVWV